MPPQVASHGEPPGVFRQVIEPTFPESTAEGAQARDRDLRIRDQVRVRRFAIASRAARAAVATVAACAALAATARADTSATILASLSPDRLRANAALTLTIRFSGGAFGVPVPVRTAVLQLPAGLRLNVPHLRSCSSRRLLARGVKGCPPQSEIGTGHAFAEAHAGSLNLTEQVTLWAFLGPAQNLQPTFEILGQGYTPLDERVVFIGRVLADRAPYGEQLALSIPAIPTLPLEPDASLVSFSLTIGAGERRRRRDPNTVVLPSSCPAGGFPFAAQFAYADGSSGSALATAPCP